MLRRLTGLISCAALTAVAAAGPQNFAQHAQNIRAGIVILPGAKIGNGIPQSAAPFALYNLDSNTSVKPAGWNFYNPFAPTVVTPTIYSRWSAIDGNTPPIGTHLAKRNAPYWEVNLDQVSDSVIANYDLLIVNPLQYCSLNPLEQMRLRRFVDNGGVLWVDPAGLNAGAAGMDEFNNLPLPFVQISGTVASPGNETTDFTSALTNSIVPLTPNDIDLLDGSISGTTLTYILSQVSLLSANIAGSTATDFFKLEPIGYVNQQPVMSLGRIGDGMVVVTARGASLKLNRSQESGTSYLTNASRFNALDPVLESDGLAAAKLAVNMVGLLRESRQQASGSRKTSSNLIDLKPPLLARSVIADPDYSSTSVVGAVNATPALYKGLLVTTVNGYLKVYDANPPVDLDGDGNPDDGTPDYEYGTPYDLIWESAQLPSPLSAPVCAEIPGAVPGTPQDEVLVVDGQGTLHIFNLEPRNPNGTLSGVAGANLSISPPTGNASYDAALTGIPIAPTVHEGIAYITDCYQNVGQNTGRIWQVNLASGSILGSTGPFVLGGNGSTTPALPEFTYSATVGYIPILDNSGGADKVLYAPFAPNPAANVNASGFLSIWLGARGEVPSTFDPQPGGMGSALTVTTRANVHGSLPIYTGTTAGLGVKLTLLDATGTPFTDAQMNSIFNGQVSDESHDGVLTFGFQGTNTTLPANVSGIRVDYTIDWGYQQNGALNSVMRGQVILPDQTNGALRSIQGPVALSPQGTAYVVNSYLPNYNGTGFPSSGTPGGGLYGFREQGVGLFNCVNRYELYGANTVVLNQATDVSAPAVLSDQDDLVNTYFPFLGNTFANFEMVGGASIRNGLVYVTATALKQSSLGQIPSTILMAFNAEPQTPSFMVGSLPATAEIFQPDFARSVNQVSPENQTQIASGSYQYDPNSQIISFPNLASTQHGPIQNCLSLSQPIILHVPGSPDKLIYPDGIGGAVWNPVSWFYVVDGMSPSRGTPLVTGNSVFFSGISNLPAILETQNFGGPTSGLLYAVSAQISASQLHPLPAQPWLNQLWMLNHQNTPIGDPNILWPQINSATSIQDLEVKLNQTILGGVNGSTVSFGVVGGDDALASWGNNGLYTYSKGNFLICDAGRIIEMDASGNPIWSTDASISAGQSAINAAGNYKPMVNPVRASRLSDTSMLVVDAGANRVATLNTTGVESRTITGFRLDPNITPSGFTAGESLGLSGPRDATYYTTYVNMSTAAGTLVSAGDGENASSIEYWQHYLIADGGNRRLIEVIDRFYYNPNNLTVGGVVTVANVPQVGVLLWHSPPSVSGKQYAYNSINRILNPANGDYIYIAGIGGSLPTRAGTGLDRVGTNTIGDAQDGSGGIVVFDPSNPLGVLTFNTISKWNVVGTSFWDPSTGVYDNVINQSTATGLATFVQRSGGPQRLSNLTSVTARLTGGTAANATIAILITDATGVYEATYTPGSQDPTQPLPVDWEITNEAYCTILQTGPVNNPSPAQQNALGLKAVYARRLDSGDIMIVNGYYGNTGYYSLGTLYGGSPFTGEIMQVDGTTGSFRTSLNNLGFNTQSVSLDLRTSGSGGTRGLITPVFADRR